MSDKNLIFQQLFEAQSSTFTYLLADKETKEAVLIDSVLETVDRDLKLIEELGLNLKYVLDTHIHADHITGAGEIRDRLKVMIAVSKNANVSCANTNLTEGDKVKFGPFTIDTIETPGHTDASLSFYCEGMVFTGDALLIRGCGRTDFQSGSATALYESVTKKLFALPKDTMVYPAHDYKGFTSSTIAAEIENNPRLGQGKTEAEFLEIMASLKLDYPKQIDRAVPANLACGSIPNSNFDSHSDFRSIFPAELRSKLGKDALIVDVRSLDEFNGELGHIPGAQQMTFGDDLTHFLQRHNRKEEIIFVCNSGRRSEQATRLSLKMGFNNVSNLLGGMLGWKALGLPIEKFN